MKRGLIGIIILSIVGVLVLVAAAGGYYAYNVHVYETLRVCLGADVDTGFSCETNQQCIDLVEKYSNESKEFRALLDDAPNFLKEKFQEGLDKGIRCEQTCILRDIRGINKETKEFEFLESCNAGEEEITLEIRGKEGLAIKKFMEEQEGK